MVKFPFGGFISWPRARSLPEGYMWPVSVTRSFISMCSFNLESESYLPPPICRLIEEFLERFGWQKQPKTRKLPSRVNSGFLLSKETRQYVWNDSHIVLVVECLFSPNVFFQWLFRCQWIDFSLPILTVYFAIKRSFFLQYSNECPLLSFPFHDLFYQIMYK